MKNIVLIIFATIQVIFGNALFLHEYDSDKIKKTFAIQNNGILEVNTCGGEIILKSWDKKEVLVEVEGIEKENQIKLKIYSEENKIIVNYRPHWGWDGAKFTITTPKDINATLKTSGGDISLEGEFDGYIQTSTSGGHITSNLLKGNATLNTSGGDILCGKISGDGFVRTSGGNIKFKSVGKRIDAMTSGGDIEIGEVGGNGIIKTSGGDIEVGNINGEVDAMTSGGDIEIGEVLTNAKLITVGGSISLDGANGAVIVKTTGGDIILKKIKGNLHAVTTGGDIKVELIPIGNSTLTTVGGDIELFISEEIKATINAFIENDWHRKNKNEIISDFKFEDYQKDGRLIRSTIHLNNGGNEIKLKTVNGNIVIRKIK